MLATRVRGTGNFTIFFLHWLSGSGQTWRIVADQLSDRFRTVTVDLPGFGASSQNAGYTVAEMAAAVVDIVQREKRGPCMLVGHSMGAKVACVVARSFENDPSLSDILSSMVLLAGSPPGPEPMSESRREEMSTWFKGSSDQSRAEARDFIRKNAASRLENHLEDETVDITLQMSRDAWLAWLSGGSREDWAERVGVLRVPTLIAAGEVDPDLGPSAQRDLMLPHFSQASVTTITGAKHLLPLEAPSAVIDLIEKASRINLNATSTRAVVPSDVERLIGSTAVSSQTRAVLLKRAEPDRPDYRPSAMSTEAFAVLRCISERVLPQDPAAGSDERRLDLAAGLDRSLASGSGNGWRYDILPADPDAVLLGLQTLNDASQRLNGLHFDRLSAEQQDALLCEIADGSFRSGTPGAEAEISPPHGNSPVFAPLNSFQMKRWFEEVRAMLVREYMSHPSTYARVGYDGFADQWDRPAHDGLISLEPVANGIPDWQEGVK